MKVAITGSNGLLGQSLVNLLKKDVDVYEVYGLSRGKNRSGRTDFTYHSIDITQEESLRACLLDIRPDFIVNTAAITNVDSCEDEKERCDQLNVEAVRYLKDIAQELNAHLIHISTDFIFDGEKGYYKETDTPNPISYYGLSKLRSEEVLTNSTIDFTILRTILVYGQVHDLGRSNIVLWVKEMLESGKSINIVTDQYRMPTYAVDLAMACKLAIDKRAKGIFNISSSELLSVFEITEQIAEAFDLDKSLIKPISTSTLNQKAPRPAKTGFDLSKTNQELGFFPGSFQEDLQRFKETLT